MNVSSIQNLAAQVSAPSEPGAARLLRDEQRNLIQAVKAVNASGMLGRTTSSPSFRTVPCGAPSRRLSTNSPAR